ncbi:TetR/AcrR family transcriptional regulator [Sulfuriflexus sp.]|uniref:TetR/AcrR family transcriptional regulator n=1 Tax=Sulfuriflexus sp. TaxID=2015443 RepID=UPI0028CE06CE|nr:TetR family transcriptional regulator C-terminal domain-containing protein [Sulfuriflexus sp.]MDT8405393.1 TetR family transcriptional regulator C-terminal domain-containing protein [Sulfuriflexus sp.]
MPRTIEFDKQETLRRAMHVFWRQGYNATSVKDLTAATHLQPGSLYGTFHNKRSLFIAALDAYFLEIRQRIQDCLYASGPPISRLRTFFAILIEETACDPEQKGCLLVNTLLEMPAEDAEINHRVSQMFAEVEGEFARILKEAQQCGDLSADKNPAVLAQLLVVGIYGLRVYHKTQPGTESLRKIADGLFAALDVPITQTLKSKHSEAQNKS